MGNMIAGADNVAIGRDALGNSPGTLGCVAIGNNALNNNSSGSFNTAIGQSALYNNVSGLFNVAIGSSAGSVNTSGIQLTLIGEGSNVLLPNLINAAAIGYDARVGANNSLVLGGTGSTQVKVGVGVTAPLTDMHIKQGEVTGNERGISLEREDNSDDWRIFIGGGSDLGIAFNNVTVGSFDDATGNYVPTSDIRLKKDIVPVQNILSKVLELQPKYYRFIAAESESRTIGFIAQDVETLFPEIVVEREDGYKGLAYDNFAVLAIQAIKEQQEIITQQHLSISNQQAVIDDLLQRVQALEQK
jgi:hypothetical protein